MHHNRHVTDEPAPEPPPEQAGLPEPDLQSTRPWARGYRQSEVDSFVEDLRRAYSHDPPTMAPYEITDQRFSPTRFSRGYTMRSVDEYLGEALERMRERHGEDAVAGVQGHETERHRHFPTELIYLTAAVLIVLMVVFAITQL
jgi:DivIVA domain-containing protein